MGGLNERLAALKRRSAQELSEMPLPGVGNYAPSGGMSTAQGIRADPIVRVKDSGRGQRIEAPNTISDNRLLALTFKKR